MNLRKLAASLLLALSFAAISAQPKAEWVANEHDFGVINENDGEATCTFTLVNAGDEPLMINNARATCGCTRPKYDKSAIAPGDSTIIEVSYDPIGRPGRFNKRVYIDTNTDPKRSTLTISGVVIATEQTVKRRFPIEAGELRLNSTIVAMGEIKKLKMKTVFLDGYNITADTIVPQWENVPEYMAVLMAPKAVPPGEQATFTFYFNTAKCPEWGLVEDSIMLIPAAGSEKRIAISTVANVKGNFDRLTPGQRMNAPQIAVSPEKVDFGMIQHNSGTITRTFEIENFGKDDLEIRRVYTSDPGIDIEINKGKLKKGKRATVTVTVDTSKISTEIFNSRITIISNDPERDEIIVRFVGEVKQ